MARIGIFGWGVVAPRSPSIDQFARNLESSGSWLTAFQGFGPSTFLAGEPSFAFEDYKRWIDERFPPTKFPQLQQKMGATTQYAIGAFIQSLQQNPGIEKTLQELGHEAQVLIGTGVGDLPTQYDCSLALHRGQRRWNRFWAAPERNVERRRWEDADADERRRLSADWGVPAEPPELAPEDGSFEAAEDAWDAWHAFWMRRSDQLARYLDELDAIENEGITGEVDSEKLSIIRRKRNAFAQLQKKWGAPEPPWLAVSPNLIWNIANTPAAQVSMLCKITGPAYAPIAACSSFGVAIKLAMQAIEAGDARACVIGMADPPPHPMLVGAFYKARVLAGSRRPSMPLSDLRGTHVAGGACVWIVGDHEFMTARGYEPLGLELLGVGVTSDAEHIITPSTEGPKNAIRLAIEDAGANGARFGSWDLHATATPGDYHEIKILRQVLSNGLLITARKGTFGHGMAVGGGWELTAQHLGLASGELQPTPLGPEDIHQEIEAVPYEYVLNEACDAPAGLAGKLSMGIGGINACVISRRWEEAPEG